MTKQKHSKSSLLPILSGYQTYCVSVSISAVAVGLCFKGLWNHGLGLEGPRFGLALRPLSCKMTARDDAF